MAIVGQELTAVIECLGNIFLAKFMGLFARFRPPRVSAQEPEWTQGDAET